MTRFKKILSLITIVCVVVTMFPTLAYAGISNKVSVGEKELGTAKKLLYETSRILESKNNMVVVDEISEYDWYWKNDPELTTEYINQFNQAIKDNKSINTKRERLEYLYDQNKSSVIAALVPNALHVINVTVSSGDPLKAIIALSGAALSSVTSYITEKQKTDLELIQKQWDLDDEQVDVFEELKENLRTYLSEVCNKYGFDDDDLSSINTLESFITQCNKYPDSDRKSASNRFMAIKTRQFEEELSSFPEYWAQLTISSYQMEDYENALKYIKKYEDEYVQVMYHDEQYARLMEIKAYCIKKLNQDGKKSDELEALADEICRMSPNANWEQKYFCAELYKEIAEEKPEKAIALNKKATQLLQEITNQIANDYDDSLDDYISGNNITEIKDGIQENIDNYNDKISELENSNKYAASTEKKRNNEKIKEYKKEVKALEKNKKTVDETADQYLPPSATLLYSMTKEYIELAKETKITNTQDYKTLYSKIGDLLTDLYSQKNLFGKTSENRIVELEYNQKQFLLAEIDDDMNVVIPAKYFLFADEQFDPNIDKLTIYFDSFKYPVTDYTYSVKLGSGDNLEDASVIIHANVKDKVDTGQFLNDKQNPKITCTFESGSMQDESKINIHTNDMDEIKKTFLYEYPEKETKSPKEWVTDKFDKVFKRK